ncbi:MAG: PAS domain-containing sensor histidine kinase [Acidobacteriales bacterium 59-55]|nr:HAMP domain-containing protein [Terriglobales bacterium]ODU53985.1 MAG: PAS domain-containing sensor histidine kinase [Granulicella sp. SCN 62-9]OJV42984.1 MAG: PAS domain-containing sensor histidine kinase [Acidobacteriales bacterium 59-55]
MPNNPNRRKVMSITLGACFVVLFAILATLNAFNKQLPRPANLEQIFLFTGLSFVAFLLFVVVLVLLARNMLKLYADQRSRVMGARLRTRMFWGAVLVSFLPIAFMFAFSYLLMNRSVDRWFSQPVTQMRDDSNHMALALSQYTTANARAEADSIAAGIADAANLTTRKSASAVEKTTPDTTPRATAALSRASREAIARVLSQHEITLQNGFAIIYRDGHAVTTFHMPQRDGATAEVKPWLPEPVTDENGTAASVHTPATNPTDAAILAAARRSDSPIFSLGQIDYALAATTVQQGSTVVVGLPMPFGMASTMSRLRKEADAYWVIFRERRQIRSLYMSLLLMMTILALFASSWIALHIAKQVTKPVEALGDAMEAIAAGDYAHRVGESATEELGELVRSFNHMAADLEGSRRAVELSTVQLSTVNAALEARRTELETMLETIPNGVATLDADRRIVLTNRALSEMMDPGGQRPFPGRSIEEAFPPEVADVIDHLIKRSHRMGSASSEVEMTGGVNDRFGGSLNLLATVALLETPGKADRMAREHRGYVLVLENATELLHAQKQSAWKEVARRVAHEIKNPLTPISLSAEQIHRHIDRLAAMLAERDVESPSPAIIRRCSEVISSSVESMRSLVDQFSALAEFPTARPRPADLNTIVENALALFAGRMQTITVAKNLTAGLPLVLADPEALKRALGNLIDNAVEAMQHSLLRELRIATAQLENGMIELTIADTGTGLTDEMRERLFLPYFSTKQRGTGLGLAIAAKIIQEHQGTIRAEKNFPAGAKFTIELKIATGADYEAELPNATAAAGIGNSNGGTV